MRCEKYKKIFDDYGGIIKLSNFTNHGYHNTILYKLIEEGCVSKIKTGYYEWIAGEPIPEVVIISKVFPEAVICLESALYIYGYSDRTPISWHVAVSKKNNRRKYIIDYPPVKFYFLVDKYIGIGKTSMVYDNNEISIYDRDRTICDIIRYEKKMDKEVFNIAVKAYVNDTKKNIGNLFKYAEEMNIKNKVKTIIGIMMI